jgi:hypothetical protein
MICDEGFCCVRVAAQRLGLRSLVVWAGTDSSPNQTSDSSRSLVPRRIIAFLLFAREWPASTRPASPEMAPPQATPA